MTYVMNTELEDNIKSALASNPALRDKILFLVAERDAYWKERVRETAYKASKDKEREDATMEEAIASAELSMDTPDTENRENSTSFGSGTNIYGDIDTLIREMFSYWDRIKESNPGSVASNDVKDPITMVIDYADSLRTSRDAYWMERVRKDVKDAYEHAEIVRQRTLNEIRQAVEDDESYGGAKECVYKILDRY